MSSFFLGVPSEEWSGCRIHELPGNWVGLEIDWVGLEIGWVGLEIAWVGLEIAWVGLEIVWVILIIIIWELSGLDNVWVCSG